MRLKHCILPVVLLLCANTSFARQHDDAVRRDDGSTTFRPHWFGSVQGGASYTVGEASFGRLVSPSVALAVGYKFNPLFGLRAEASGWQAKGGWVNPATAYKYNYLQGAVDAMLDLSNLCCGFHPGRVFNAYLFAGAGLNGAFGNDEAARLQADGYNLKYLWTGKKLYVSGRAGVGANFRLTSALSLNLELNTNILSDKFNSKKGRNVDWQFNGLAGLSFTFGKSCKKAAPSVSQGTEQPAAATEAAPSVVTAPTEEQPQPKKEPAAVVESMQQQNIFFALNSAKIQADQQKKIASLAEYLAKHPSARVNLTGYADVDTGNARINLRLSETRARNVAEALKAKGIAADRISVDFKGDTVQPFSTPTENRVCICITE